MPIYPEGDTALASDDERRSAQKWNELLYESIGQSGGGVFPEGNQPLLSDDLRRSLIKINALYNHQ